MTIADRVGTRILNRAGQSGRMNLRISVLKIDELSAFLRPGSILFHSMIVWPFRNQALVG